MVAPWGLTDAGGLGAQDVTALGAAVAAKDAAHRGGPTILASVARCGPAPYTTAAPGGQSVVAQAHGARAPLSAPATVAESDPDQGQPPAGRGPDRPGLSPAETPAVPFTSSQAPDHTIPAAQGTSPSPSASVVADDAGLRAQVAHLKATLDLTAKDLCHARNDLATQRRETERFKTTLADAQRELEKLRQDQQAAQEESLCLHAARFDALEQLKAVRLELTKAKSDILVFEAEQTSRGDDAQYLMEARTKLADSQRHVLFLQESISFKDKATRTARDDLSAALAEARRMEASLVSYSVGAEEAKADILARDDLLRRSAVERSLLRELAFCAERDGEATRKALGAAEARAERAEGDAAAPGSTAKAADAHVDASEGSAAAQAAAAREAARCKQQLRIAEAKLAEALEQVSLLQAGRGPTPEHAAHDEAQRKVIEAMEYARKLETNLRHQKVAVGLLQEALAQAERARPLANPNSEHAPCTRGEAEGSTDVLALHSTIDFLREQLALSEKVAAELQDRLSAAGRQRHEAEVRCWRTGGESAPGYALTCHGPGLASSAPCGMRVVPLFPPCLPQDECLLLKREVAKLREVHRSAKETGLCSLAEPVASLAAPRAAAGAATPLGASRARLREAEPLQPPALAGAPLEARMPPRGGRQAHEAAAEGAHTPAPLPSGRASSGVRSLAGAACMWALGASGAGHELLRSRGLADGEEDSLVPTRDHEVFHEMMNTDLVTELVGNATGPVVLAPAGASAVATLNACAVPSQEPSTALHAHGRNGGVALEELGRDSVDAEEDTGRVAASRRRSRAAVRGSASDDDGDEIRPSPGREEESAPRRRDAPRPSAGGVGKRSRPTPPVARPPESGSGLCTKHKFCNNRYKHPGKCNRNLEPGAKTKRPRHATAKKQLQDILADEDGAHLVDLFHDSIND